MPFLSLRRRVALLVLASAAAWVQIAASGAVVGRSLAQPGQTRTNQTQAGQILSGPISSGAKRSIEEMYRDHQWGAVVAAVPLPGTAHGDSAHGAMVAPDADLLLLRALAQGQLAQLSAAAQTLRFAARAYPRDARFPTELAGVLYRQKRYGAAAGLLRRALRLNPRDEYSRNFLGTVDFLQGNLAAALADWNPIQRPVLADQQLEAPAGLPPLLLERIAPFAARSVYTLRQYRRTEAKLALQPLFAADSFELRPLADGRFNLIVHTVPHPAWRTEPIGSLLSTLRSLPYQAVDPEFWNLDHSAVSFTSYLRWDAQKRMILARLAGPMHSPDQRLSVSVDARNENWNLTRTLVPTNAPRNAKISGLNQERIVASLGVDELFGSRLLWRTAAGFSRRRFRSEFGLPAGSAFFTDTSAVEVRSDLRATLVDAPARRFRLASTVGVEVSHYFTRPLNRSARLTAALDSRWLPEASGNRYRLRTQARAGATVGEIPFDALWMLGFDRDNPLWMRGHNGLIDGRKGNAPLGTRYLLGNVDFDRLVWRDPLVSVRVGPFVDTGRIYASGAGLASQGAGANPAPDSLFGSPVWLTDTGVQARVHLFTGSTLMLGWGHELRSGGNTFYSAISH